ncbi:MAG: methyl-accepting chemotaxis protein [Gammaproteobacteria bacterium]|nr:methyl-accepting chemotaxis protein [Gammaproteobacteria bacterium]
MKLSFNMGKRPKAQKQLVHVVGAVLLMCLIGFAAVFIYTTQQNAQITRYLSTTSDLRLYSQTMTGNATAAVASFSGAGFAELKFSRDEFAKALDLLQRGDPATGLKPSPKEVAKELQTLDANWQGFRFSIDEMVAEEELFVTIGEFLATINQVGPVFTADTEQVVKMLAASGASTADILRAGDQMRLSHSILNHMNQLFLVSQNSTEAAHAIEQIISEVDAFKRTLDAMQGKGDGSANVTPVSDPAILLKLGETATLFQAVTRLNDYIQEKFGEVYRVKDDAQVIFVNGQALLSAAEDLGLAYQTLQAGLRTLNLFGYALGVLALLCMISIGYLMRREASERAAKAEQQNSKNQEAILTLLDEMVGLQDGDLTVRATVTEAFTGAIADAVNSAIDSLRSLVRGINETTVHVASAAQETQTTAMHLSEASNEQAARVAEASAAINEMAVSIQEVAANANESAQVAQNSVQIANQGAQAVQNTIQGMDRIREQIQETSKRIKRLGESSQEIGEIVELISDIADQTNILALNAAIQAAMAGEAGRGFAVVADEVQRLAERSANATKQIDALVKTIQGDTSEAIGAMEQSTSNVVAGAKIAHNADESLKEIERVSNHLAELVQNISHAARQQSAASANISDTMNVVREIATQTSVGSTEAAASVGNLADLANELRKSVAGFKLPA